MPVKDEPAGFSHSTVVKDFLKVTQMFDQTLHGDPESFLDWVMGMAEI